MRDNYLLLCFLIGCCTGVRAQKTVSDVGTNELWVITLPVIEIRAYRPIRCGGWAFRTLISPFSANEDSQSFKLFDNNISNAPGVTGDVSVVWMRSDRYPTELSVSVQASRLNSIRFLLLNAKGTVVARYPSHVIGVGNTSLRLGLSPNLPDGTYYLKVFDNYFRCSVKELTIEKEE